MSRRDVVVSGLGVISSIGNDVPSYRAALRDGKDGISRIEGFDTSGIRSCFAGEIKRSFDEKGSDHRPVDRASALALISAREAWRESGVTTDGIDRRRAGVFLGSCSGGFLNGLRYLANVAKKQRGRTTFLLDLPLHAAASRIACEIGLQGPVSVVSNACASSGIAIAYGAELIRSGRADVMLVGGYDALTPMNLVGFGMMRNSSLSNRIRPFDKDRDGMLLGEGAAMLVLEERSRCDSRGGAIRARLLGWGITSDTYHMTAPDPSGRGAARAMELALAGIDQNDVSYINAHGTGTLHNDLMEAVAIRRVFGERAAVIPVSSTKSMIGHTLGAAGALELVASIAAMNDDFVPPTINYETIDPKCHLDCVPNRSRAAKINILLSNSFGFGGTNCCIAVGHPRSGSY
jgi:3-oxoacyl-[acyl-carrier-protein] synthase II